jgi:hypothetical protein
MGEHDFFEIAQSMHYDRQNSSNLTETAIAPHVLKQNQAIMSFSREW